jgi:hypothetical protein
MGPRYWRDKHSPRRGEEADDESGKLTIHFDALRTTEDRRSRRAIRRGVLEALGIKKETEPNH